MTGLPGSEDVAAVDDPLDSWLCELRPSKPPPVVDLSRTPARLMFSASTHEACVRFMRLYYGYLEHLFRLSVVIFVGLLFVDHGAIRLALLVVHPFTTMAIYTATFFLSLDLLGLLVRSYDFWFMTVFNFFHWSTLAYVLSDTRAMCCFVGYLSSLHANAVDANLRNAKATIAVGLLGVLLFIALTALVTWQCIVDQRPFDIVINGRIQGDAGDVLTFTTSTFAVFLIKLGLIK